MNHRIECSLKEGFNRILDIGERGMILTGFALLKLGKGETWSMETKENEVALVLLGGKGIAMAGDRNFGEIGKRPDVFSGYPYTLYLPIHSHCSFTATTEVEIAVCESPGKDEGKPILVTPDEVATTAVTIGKENYERNAVIMIGDGFPTRHFFIGEAWVPSGNWASYPPHRHDEHNPPTEVDMEEIYFFRFKPQTGFGVQRIYTDDHSTDVAYTVRENDTIVIPEGYHPVICAPGYVMYYLWVMTGDSPAFISYKDPTHAAVVQ